MKGCVEHTFAIQSVIGTHRSTAFPGIGFLWFDECVWFWDPSMYRWHPQAYEKFTSYVHNFYSSLSSHVSVFSRVLQVMEADDNQDSTHWWEGSGWVPVYRSHGRKLIWTLSGSWPRKMGLFLPPSSAPLPIPQSTDAIYIIRTMLKLCWWSDDDCISTKSELPAVILSDHIRLLNIPNIFSLLWDGGKAINLTVSFISESNYLQYMLGIH